MDNSLGRFAGAVGIFGGSFNPPHLAHLRMAIEVREQLDLAQVDFVPAAVPPHKRGQLMLPFALRLRLVAAMLTDVQGCELSALEREVDGPSYSFETLLRLRRTHPQQHFLFILGSTDFLTLPAWHRGLELPLTTDLAVVEREDIREEQVRSFARQEWAVRELAPQILQVPDGGNIALLTMPRQDISASLVREKFLQGLDIRGLVPEAVRAGLYAHRAICMQHWTS